MIDPDVRNILDAHLAQLEGLTDLLGRLVVQQAEIVRRLAAVEIEVVRARKCDNCSHGLVRRCLYGGCA